jgi:diguanylate cyclase (GGDEF)-like protein
MDQLAGYLTTVSSSADESSALAGAVQGAAGMLGAQVGAVVIGDRLHGCRGLGDDVPEVGLQAVANGAGSLHLPGLGDLHAVPGTLGADVPGTLVIARHEEPFSPAERQLVQGMAQVLGLALRSIRALSAERALRAARDGEAAERLVLLDSLRTRQHLVETLLAIQRAISSRRPLPEILNAVTEGAAKLLDGAVVALVLAEPGRGELVTASTSGAGQFADPERPRAEAREAMDAGTVLIRPFDPDRIELGTLIVAPVRVTGEMAGSLVAHFPGEAQRTEQRDQLKAFAQQVSLALADARTVEAVREAHHDSLTGLPNRALFLKIFNRLLVTRGDSAESTSVLFIDLDRFKAVNDSLGHEAGDQLLAAVAGRIRGCVRSGDTTARLGGDEFAVLLHNSPVESATAVGERIIAAVREPFRLAGRDAFIGASVGVAITLSASADSDEMLNNADVAMYRAKKEGGGKVVVFTPQMHTEALEYLSLRADLQRALHESEFRLVYQPLVRLDTGQIAAVETLIRWHSPTRGVVSPLQFIPIAEDTGLIVDIGQWVLVTSAAQVAQWRRTLPDLTLNVNVSGRQLVHPQFADNVARALAAARLPAAAVTLELTESVLMSDPDTAMTCLAKLKDQGVQLAIDDFGTGYSSLSYLRELPVDELKIDRTFIARAALTGEDLAFVRTIVDLGHILGLRVVAEGIEDEAQLDALRGLGCALGQGYLLCRPADAARMPEILARRRLTSTPAAALAVG